MHKDSTYAAQQPRQIESPETPRFARFSFFLLLKWSGSIKTLRSNVIGLHSNVIGSIAFPQNNRAVRLGHEPQRRLWRHGAGGAEAAVLGAVRACREDA